MLDAANLAAYLEATQTDAGEKSFDVTVDAAVNDTDYVFAFVADPAGADELTITFTVNSGAGATTTTIATALRNAVLNDTDNDGPQDGTISNFITASSMTNVVTVSGVLAGDFFDITTLDANLTVGGALFAGATVDSTSLEPLIGDVLTPAPLASNVDNYNPSGLNQATLLRLDGGVLDRSITGIVPAHRMLIVRNVGTTNNIELRHENASSAAANRFTNVGATTRTLAVGEAILLVYDPIATRWCAAS